MLEIGADPDAFAGPLIRLADALQRVAISTMT